MKDIKLYKAAFMEALECEEKDFEMKPYMDGNKGGPMLAKYGDAVYKVNSSDDLYQYAEAHLTDELAFHLPPYIVSDIMEDIHASEKFYSKLLDGIRKEHKEELALLLSVYNTTQGDFWGILYEHADPLLCAKAVNAATEMYDLEILKGELVEEWVVNGDELLSMHVEGIFKEVVFNEDTPSEECFYIYDVDYVFYE
ncbi:hypothetical protein [Maribacter sp. 2-571]|uniref:hypothetical protein n=1 Tax=Maribacter sp. 2-571 TaxID=3417569 RepID=UPI003D32C9F1